MSRSNTLLATYKKAEAHPSVSLYDIQLLVGDHDARTRLLGLFLMRRSIDEGNHPETFFNLAKPLIEDSENNCRWQALIVVGEAIESSPDQVWGIVREYGDSTDSDMRTAVATVLLEHLLDFHFEKFFEQVRTEVSD